MKTFCIYCPEIMEAYQAAVLHFAKRDVPAEFLSGIHGEAFGILGTRPYRFDSPKRGEVTGYRHTGLVLSHYMVWTACSVLPDRHYMILEDDAEFPQDWKKRFEPAWKDVPQDFDILILGGSNCSDKDKKQIRGSVWEIKYPFTTHAYIVAKKALPVLLENMRDASMPIDIGLIHLAYPKLKVYTVLPRIVNQRKTELQE